MCWLGTFGCMNSTSTQSHTRPSASERGYTYRWREYSKGFLKGNPLCVICKANGRTVAAECVDHTEPHKGDEVLFWDPDNHQAVCLKCNSRKAAREEGRWAPKSYTMPDGLRPSLIPLTIVCGPPGGGKNYYVNNHVGAGDLVVDADAICMEMTGKRLSHAGRRWISDVFRVRNEVLKSLAVLGAVDAERAWLIVGAPTMKVRQHLVDGLKPESVVMIFTDHETCVDRVKNDPVRVGCLENDLKAVTDWWKRFGGFRVEDMVVEG